MNFPKIMLTNTLALGLMLAGLVLSSAQERTQFMPLEGSYRMSSHDCQTDPSADCVFYVEFRGKTAQAAYDSMKSAPVEDMCTGGHVKSDNDTLICFSSADNGHSCHFGYDFKSQMIVTGDVSC
jgi:hypothetical protein